MSGEDVIARIKEYEGIRTDKEVAQLLGGTSKNITGWRRSGVPWERLDRYARERDLSLE